VPGVAIETPDPPLLLERRARPDPTYEMNRNGRQCDLDHTSLGASMVTWVLPQRGIAADINRSRSRERIRWEIKLGLWLLIRSKHTRDVVIVAAFSLIFLISLFAVWIVAGWHAWTEQNFSKTSLSEAVKSLSGIASIIGILGRTIIALIAWAYRTANQRLAVVNTIASDIYTILRISASLYVVQNLILMYRSNITGTYAYLIAREEYSLVGKINLGDIGFLNQNTIKRVNAFYITLRAYRDRALTLAEWLKTNTTRSVLIDKDGREEIRSGVVNDQGSQEFRSLICGVIYYAFQCIENGRIALHELLEDPEFRDEAVFAALIQDLRAFTFLIKEADPKLVQSYLKRRLEERIRGGLRRRDREENYLFIGYRSALRRVKEYIEELHDHIYNENLRDLFGANLVVLFGKEFVENIRV
jgi:hypothetical protein